MSQVSISGLSAGKGRTVDRPAPWRMGKKKFIHGLRLMSLCSWGAPKEHRDITVKGPRSARALRGRTRGEGGGACTCRRFLLTLSPPAPRMHLMSTMARRPRRVARDRLTLTNIQTVGAVARKLK